MTENDFLASYDPTTFPRPSVAVDLVLMTVTEGKLAVLLQQRQDFPCKGDWALPGGFVGIDEDLDTAAKRIMASKGGLAEGWLEQLYTFGAPARDPRMRIITVAYFALMPADRLATALVGRSDLMLAPLEVPWAGEEGGSIEAIAPDGGGLALAFDHGEIISHAVKRLRGKLEYSTIAFALLPDQFTLRDLQDSHEAILGIAFNKPAFRRRMLDKGWIEGTGARESGTSYRPAELYRLKSEKVA